MSRLTTPDLVVLAFLAEQPRHGYGLIAELERCEVEDWAEVSRAQVYYSLRKAAAAGWITEDEGGAAQKEGGTGPQRTVFRITPTGKDQLRAGLGDQGWATHRAVPPFLTWLALSPHLPALERRRVIRARRHFLLAEIAREEATLEAIAADTETPAARRRLADAMVRFTLQQFRAEVAWLDSLRS